MKVCYVNKGSVPNPKLHRVKPRQVNWSSGTTETRDLPACGTKVDVCAIEYEHGETIESLGYAGDACGRCFPKAQR
jgi:hypothetical protein